MCKNKTIVALLTPGRGTLSPHHPPGREKSPLHPSYFALPLRYSMVHKPASPLGDGRGINYLPKAPFFVIILSVFYAKKRDNIIRYEGDVVKYLYIKHLTSSPLHNNTMALQNRYITLYYYAKFRYFCFAK